MTDTLKLKLNAYKNGELSQEDMLRSCLDATISDVGQALLDDSRMSRKGFPEVILAQGKTTQQIIETLSSLSQNGQPALASRISDTDAKTCLEHFENGTYFEPANIFLANPHTSPIKGNQGNVALVSAGLADQEAAEEAGVLLEIAGYTVNRVYDVGVAGLQRLLSRLPELETADVMIVAAGMDGALVSVVAGLVSQPVIALPTSKADLAGLDGLAALLTMLNTCSPGVGVVNIDNGYGAAMLAHSILSGMKNQSKKLEKG